MSATICSKSPVASGWKTIAGLAARRDAVLGLERDVRRRDREQPVGRRALDLALAQERVEEAHGLLGGGRDGALLQLGLEALQRAIRFSIGGCVEKRLKSECLAPAGKM